MLGVSEKGPQPKIEEKDDVLTIRLPALTPDIIPCQHIWVLEIEGANVVVQPPAAGDISQSLRRSSRKHTDME